MIVTQSILLYDSLDEILCMEVYIVTILRDMVSTTYTFSGMFN